MSSSTDNVEVVVDGEPQPSSQSVQPSRRSGAVASLRTVISTISAALVVLVAAVTLALLMSSSRSALEVVGTGYASALLDGAVLRTTVLFAQPATIVESLAQFVGSETFPWPSDDTSVIPMFMGQLLTGYHAVDNAATLGMLIYFWDNTRLSVTPHNATHYYTTLLLPSPISAPGGLSNQTMSGYNTWYRYDREGAPVREPYAFSPTEEYRTRNNTASATMLAATAQGFRTGFAGYVARSVEDDRGQFVLTYVPVVAPLVMLGGSPGRQDLYGFGVTGLRLEAISSFLAATRATPNSEAFATDFSQHLLGSTRPERFLTMERVPLGTPATLGCATTESVGSASTGPNTLVCRASRREFPFRPLQELPDDVFRHEGARVALLKLAGGTYYVASADTPMPLRGFTVRLALLMPETDVIGDVIKSRNAAIGIVAALVVLSMIVNYVSVLLLLRPLDGIAARMVKAANLDDDETDTSVSSMAEVAALQLAYYEMNDELNRIRSFVPQSVLMAKKNAAAGETDGDEEEDAELQSISHHSSINNNGGGGASLHSVTGAGQSVTGPKCGGPSLTRHPHELSGSGRNQNQLAQSNQSSLAGAGSRPPALKRDANALTGLSLKPVTGSVLVANMCGFHQALAAHGRDEALARLAELVEFVYVTADGLGGVVASYHGDHFVLTFNAVKRCGEHAAAAARAGLALRDEAMAKGFGAALRVGVASGRLQVGNVGSKQVKAFSAMGPAFQHACVLERLSRLYSGADERGVLLPRRTCMDIQTRFRYRYVDVVVLPGRDRGGPGGTNTPVALLLSEIGKKPAGEGSLNASTKNKKKAEPEDDEWLYIVGGDEASDPFADWNRCFDLLCGGRADDALHAMDAFTQATSLGKREAESPLVAKFRSLCEKPDGERLSDLGAFYTVGYALC